MGEYASYNGKEIKIGTCENMYYLRANQADLVEPLSGNVNPIKDAGEIRFRFPFPQEDGNEPGNFEDYDFGLGLSGIEPPEGIEHYSIQFSSNMRKGLLLSTACPESKEGKASGLKFHYNGYSGKVVISQQRLVEGKLVLVCMCGSCGAKYRLPTIADAEPVIAACLREAKTMERYGQSDYWLEVAKRITNGYTQPNLWTAKESVEA